MMKSQDDTANTLKYYAGIDLGGTGIKCGIVDENGKIIAIKKCPTRKGVEAKEIISDMANLVKDLQKETGLTLEGVGPVAPDLSIQRKVTSFIAAISYGKTFRL